MRITFLMPGYPWTPSGGPRVVYEYANRLVARGHHVTLVHPRHLDDAPLGEGTLYLRLRAKLLAARDVVAKPKLDWHTLDKRVKVVFVPNADVCNMPRADAIFATACFTVDAVLQCPEEMGEKFYLIQGYETWMKPKSFVDATWRMPLHKIVIARWLLEMGENLGVSDITYIPSAIDHERYKCITPVEERPRQVAMLFSGVPLKGARDGVRALEIVRDRHPDLTVVFFGAGRRQSWIPAWIKYYRNPPQTFLIREIYNQSSIFLSPSWSEGFPLPPAEAASCGCAIVAAENGGIQEYVKHAVTGLLSPTHTPSALAANICTLLENDALRIRLALAARAAIQRFNWEHSTNLLEEFIGTSQGSGCTETRTFLTSA